MTSTISVIIFRRSVNTNSFGLRQYWCVETEKRPGAKGRACFSFCTSENLATGATQIRYHEAKQPAYELVNRRPDMPDTIFNRMKMVADKVAESRAAAAA